MVAGCGGWCSPYHDMVEHLPAIETKFERVIIMPSSFDVSVPSVRSTLAATKALVFARERTSFHGICRLCDTKIAYDFTHSSLIIVPTYAPVRDVCWPTGTTRSQLSA